MAGSNFDEEHDLDQDPDPNQSEKSEKKHY
jgi:hypothetical protein